ncbi:hypothetical protein BJ138DRAFT_1119331 [Hygrophoropsis aurantiaca]|uniref:Uncharacterized protein n=1 Tax=Hygrophoropsis aurantiaca TaxID=72124 RepID=A0ACB7ZTY0_9AGAM|nr:hypothetical protein BJ138DRAFT_1119331 [Hygrophoropsis aurantiaca]
MTNLDGRNQWGEKEYPKDAALYAAFEQYAKENSGSGLKAEEQLVRLKSEFGLDIRRSKLYELRKRLSVKSVRKNIGSSAQEQVQAVLDVKANDLAGKWGVAQVRQRLANQGTLIKRDNVRQILHDHFDLEFEKRFVGHMDGLRRIPLDCLGPWHQEHLDGHEKLAEQALRMGEGVSLPIYGGKDQYSSFVPYLRVLPNVRCARTIAHAFLDFVEEYGCIPLQLTTDKGSEIGEMVRCHERLRLNAAPEFTIERWPAAIQVQSKHNTPIEGFWRWKRAGEGHSIKSAIFIGKDAGLFNPNNHMHVQVFRWLWPPLVQERLDEFREYWNNHRLSPQKHKLLPSGTSPRQMWLAPESVRANARNCSISVDTNLVRQLREELGGAEERERLMNFVDAEFKAAADDALGQLGYPIITLSSAWDVFVAVVDILTHV